ncbi:glycogen/starch/alpha-glucan phosphorylase [Motilimonas cestriensis]|uniref:Alpha-1,4 glucan phosphorylase n=1 Tax=Motilimonas cestriensis TaxID=2742685 RepID=A0ABS8WAU0_9GAMM|nr:glycogen/starch/alpha-glucan phosphorylase [Motilimonas cestriensis]MCE2596139.1 glycogen/starch/alpha-glucan phosphorylase [Motilimonas cestriensis]
MLTKEKPTSLSVEKLKLSIVRHLRTTLASNEHVASQNTWWQATCFALNEEIFENAWSTFKQTRLDHCARTVNYLSLEFLIGRLTTNNLINLGLEDKVRQALNELGQDINAISGEERDPSLGNGGLGRLAACFMDSLVTLEYPAVGYGLHYQYGLFRQGIKNGEQVEYPDNWRDYGYPFEVCRSSFALDIPLYGHVETYYQGDTMRKRWVPSQYLRGVPWDIPVVGFEVKNVNTLRLWECRAVNEFDLNQFNQGCFASALHEKVKAESVTQVLYPNDESEMGKELRLIQQYFLCACSVRDIINRHKEHFASLDNLCDTNVMQLNDTHPAIAIPELMRILLDEEGIEWDKAWKISQRCFAYTNHTLLPEALETWPVDLIAKVLPRHIEIINEINYLFLSQVVEKQWPGDQEKLIKLSIFEEGYPRQVRMANLSVIGSYKVNGVAKLHTQLVKSDLFPEFDALFPDRLVNVTNGVTPRRWLRQCNPALAQLISANIGPQWQKDLSLLAGVEKYATDKKFVQQYADIKLANKQKLANYIKDNLAIDVSTEAIFDVQIKRLHEYKRQHLNLLHILTLYRRLLADPNYDMHSRVFIFAAKAAPGYRLAKDIIYAINKVAAVINSDERIKGKIKVVFLPDYSVTLAELIIPAADVSEQISTAGKEASGTGNMKLGLNGALTLGTLDGANVEIAEEVGDEHAFIFGLTVDQVNALKASGYRPQDYIAQNDELKAVVDWLCGDKFTPEEPGRLSSIAHSLVQGGDPYLVLADFAAYVEAQAQLDKAYRNRTAWLHSTILNTARLGKFSSDRSIEDYVRDIWHLKKVSVK